jgi:hypothetical protein
MKRSITFASLILITCMLFLCGCTESNTPEPSPADARAKFLGTWNVSEAKGGKNFYQVTISADANSSDKIRMSNFGAFNATAIATVSGNTLTLLSNQQLSTVLLISGNGTYSTSTSTILITYIYNDNADQVTVTAYYSK